MLPAIANGFPFVFMDTVDYVILTPRMYRSPFYGFFVFLTGWKTIIWAVVVAQALIVSHLVAMTLALFGQRRFALPAILVLACLSSAAIFVGFVMPDILTGVMFLALYDLIFHRDALSKRQRLYLALLATMAMACHLSHLTMAVGIIAFSAVLLTRQTPSGAWRGLGLAAATTLAVVIATVSYNAVVFSRVALSPAGSTFLLANLLQYGPARDELRETCGQRDYKLCRRLDDVPKSANVFLWHDGPLRQLGGFEGMSDEAGRVVADTLRHRPAQVARMVGYNFVRALGHNRPSRDIASIATTVSPQAEVGATRLIGQVYGGGAMAAFNQSLQQRNRWPGETLDTAMAVALLVATVALLLLSWRAWRRADRSALNFVAFVSASYLGSALTCSALSGVHDRYQARVTWLVVLAAIILTIRAYSQLQNKVSRVD